MTITKYVALDPAAPVVPDKQVLFTEPSKPAPGPPRWWTLEFMVYYALLLAGLIAAFSSAFTFSSVGSASYQRFGWKLSRGWILGRQVDNSDAQYAAFRNRLPLAVVAFALYTLVHRVLIRVTARKAPAQMFKARAAMAVAGIAALHSANAIKILTALGLNFAVGHLAAGRPYAPLATWSFALGTLFLLEYGEWRWEAIAGPLAFLDDAHGLIKRWDITFNLSVLRLISYNMDLHWSRSGGPAEALISRHQAACKECLDGDCEKLRAMRSVGPYDLYSYCAYVLYLPLFIAGPIVPFNSFVSQTLRPTPRINARYVAAYGLRVLGSILALELLLHSLWVVAIKDTDSWRGFTPLQFCSLGIWNLFVVWLKLLIIWRFFRFFALCDGIEAPENMERCICNNYSGFGFWRGWHRSFNLWIIRYMYIPLGGSTTSAWNIWPIFTFVALWHDFEWKMLLWGWLIAVFMVPELLATFLARRWRLARHPHYRHMAAAAGCLNLLQVTVCNLIGFALGIEGTKEMLRAVLSLRQIGFAVGLVTLYFANVQIVFEVREEERRRGIHKNF